METNRPRIQRPQLNDLQQLILVILLVMLLIAVYGPIPLYQMQLWIVLCLLFGALGASMEGDPLWRHVR